MDFSFSLETLAILFAVAALAGFLDTLAGGGGLITIPALLLAQAPPLHAIATNKFQGSFGTLTATFVLIRQGVLRFSEVRGMFIWSFVGATVGAIAVLFVRPQALNIVIPVVLIGIAVYFIFAPKAGDIDRRPRLSETAYQMTVAPAIGFYDGMFGPGTGSFFTLTGVAMRGKNLVTATAHAKALNFASNIAALLVFIAGGKILWVVGLVMAIGQIVGAWAGSHVVIRGGARFIRYLIVTVCFAMVGRYCLSQ